MIKEIMKYLIYFIDLIVWINIFFLLTGCQGKTGQSGSQGLPGNSGISISQSLTCTLYGNLYDSVGKVKDELQFTYNYILFSNGQSYISCNEGDIINAYPAQSNSLFYSNDNSLCSLSTTYFTFDIELINNSTNATLVGTNTTQSSTSYTTFEPYNYSFPCTAN